MEERWEEACLITQERRLEYRLGVDLPYMLARRDCNTFVYPESVLPTPLGRLDNIRKFIDIRQSDHMQSMVCLGYSAHLPLSGVPPNRTDANNRW